MSCTSPQYHNLTSYHRDKMEGHSLDWQNRPSLFKTYPGIKPVHLPKKPQLPKQALSHLITPSRPKPARVLNIDDLSMILLLTDTLTAKASHGGERFYYRSVASAGALYPTEIYVATRTVDGLNDGLYHFDISGHNLIPLQKGDLTAGIMMSTHGIEHPSPSLVFFLSAIYFRSAWKYRNRSYRYHLLDTGHLLENLRLSLNSVDLPSPLSYDFDDTKINHLLGLDKKKEVCLAICWVPGTGVRGGKEPEELPDLPPVVTSASRVASQEIDYPVIREFHEAGAKKTVYTKNGRTYNLGITPEKWIKVSPLKKWPETRNYTESLFARRSRRNFVREIIPTNYATAFLESLFTTGFKDPMEEDRHTRTIRTGLLIERCEGFQPGFYMAEMDSGSIGLVSPGPFVDKMAGICLDQTWLANAALLVLFFTNLHTLERSRGPRGYRYAMMTAGKLGERLYLVATAMGLGCCGIGAFYDREGSDLLGLNWESDLLYVVGIGPVKSGF